MMKKIHLLFLCFVFIVSSAVAQTPMHYNTNVASGANTFPFANTGTSRKVTWFIPANSLVNPTPVGAGNNITKVWFNTGNTANATYPIINVNLKQGTGTGLVNGAGGACETGLTTCFTGVNYFVSCTTGGWMSFTLTTPFLYNPAFPLIVEVEHNNTTGVGPYVYQAVAIPGPGNGRQWSNYQAVTITGAGNNQVNFGIDVLPATPCTQTPSANIVVTPTAPVCPNSNVQVSLANSYSVGGLTYQWQSSTVSPVGPFTAIPSGTNAVLNTSVNLVTVYYNAIITCTNIVVNPSVTATSNSVNVSGVITSNVPYYESFAGIGQPNKLPNCSWTANNIPTTCQTYTSAQNQNRNARTGNEYAAFYYSPAFNNFFWTNGIQLYAGVTYSTSMWFQTEYQGATGYNLNMWVGPNQSTVAANIVATTGGVAASASYKSLSNTFSVATSGIYYMGINGVSSGVCCPNWMSWDDLEIIVPCDLNPSSMSINSNFLTICQGQTVNLTANGADTYTWNTGANTPAISANPNFNTAYTVVGTNTTTGCTSTLTQAINVNETPVVSAVASSPTICAGQSTFLTAFGASTYTWNNNANTNIITVSPAVNTTYTVLGTNALGCTGTGVIALVVNPLPNITIQSSSSTSLVCQEDETILTGNGGVTYQWLSSTGIYLGSPISVSPNSTTTYSLVGTASTGCSKTVATELTVTTCTGIKNVSTTQSGVSLYPNPTNGVFTIELNSGSVRTIEVADVSGRVIMNKSQKGGKINFDLSNYSNGVYYVKVTTENASEVIKIVKQ